MVPRERTLSGLRFRDGDAVRFGERAQCVARESIERAAACDNQRALRRPQERRNGYYVRIYRWECRVTNVPRCEQIFGKIVRHRLHVLGQRERDRTAQRGIGQDADGARQRIQQLCRVRDAIEITRYRLEAIVGRNGAVVKIFDLLQHRIRRTRDEDIAGKKEHRQAIHMRERRRRHEIGCPRPDRCRARHHAPAHVRFSVSNRGVRHCLLAVRAIRRQFVSHRIQRFADAGDVAVAEDREDAAE